MSAEPFANSRGEAGTGAPKPKTKPRLDPRYIAPMLVTAVLLGAHFSSVDEGGRILKNPLFTISAILTSIVVEVALGRFITGKTPHLASAYVSGISVGILIRSLHLWVFVLTAAISIASKYVLRAKGRHLWNPSNFGIAAMVLLAAPYMSTLNVQFGNDVRAMAVIWLLGSFIISRLKRFHICATYALTFLALAGVRAAITGHNFWTEAAPITGPMYQLFVFFMITDPKTTVTSKKGQIAVAIAIGVVEMLLRLSAPLWPVSLDRVSIHAPYYALFTVGPIANAIEIYLGGKKKGGAASTAVKPALA